MVEFITNSQLGERGREIINWLVEAVSKSERIEGRRKIGDWLVESPTKSEMREKKEDWQQIVGNHIQK